MRNLTAVVVRRMVLWGLGLAAAVGAAASPLPPVRATVRADLFILGEGVPPLPVVVSTEPLPDGGLELRFEANEPELQLRALARLGPDGEGTWEIEQARLNLPHWWKHLTRQWAPEWADVVVTGELRAHGGGRWTESGPVGPLQLTWAEGSLERAEPALRIEGLELALELTGWAGGTRAGRGALRFDQARVGELDLHRGAVDVEMEGELVRLGPARVEGLGGRLVIAPFLWRSGQETMLFNVELNGIEISALAALAPQVVRAATGSVSGKAVLQWRAETGLEPIGGELAVDEGQQAQVRLAPQPGFLTDSVPQRYRLIPRLSWLPGWIDRVAERWAPANPAYRMLEGIELGRVPLRVQELTVEFFPPDHPLKRSLQVQIRGQPTNGEVVDQVSITLNVAGPVAQVVRLGLDSRSKISGGKVQRPGR